ASPPTGAVVQAVLDKALADAASLIHGYARSAGYEVPFGSPAPDPVPQWQADIAFYLLHRGRQPSDSLVKDYDRALAQLRDLAAGRIKLQAAGVSAPAASEDTVVLFEGPSRMFTDMGGF
ncbi:phage protein Gp36 family protein, partial [Fundidesulfovibrio butyratiphilus]